MSMLSLMWANLFRKRTRTALTLLSVTVAFLLFMLLRSISDAFDVGPQIAGNDRLVVGAKYSQIDNLPYSQKQQILAIDGVDAVTHSTWFGGMYQDGRSFFAQFPVMPLEYFNVYSEFDLEPADALERFARERGSAVIDIGLVDRFGWQVGDVVPLISQIYTKEDGSRDFEFEIVGTFSQDGKSSSFPVLLFHYERFRESVQFGGDAVSQWTVRVSEPERADEIAQEIDALFENSSDPTRTTTEDESNREFARQLGDMGFITTMIMSAVFFTIVLLTGNTMAQALRERIPELAVLKTLGFTDTQVSLLVLGEAVLLCLVGGAMGVGIAFLIGPGMSVSLEGLLGSFEVAPTTALVGLGVSLLIGLVIGALPAITAKRLAIVDALRR